MEPEQTWTMFYKRPVVVRDITLELYANMHFWAENRFICWVHLTKMWTKFIHSLGYLRQNLLLHVKIPRQTRHSLSTAFTPLYDKSQRTLTGPHGGWSAYRMFFLPCQKTYINFVWSSAIWNKEIYSRKQPQMFKMLTIRDLNVLDVRAQNCHVQFWMVLLSYQEYWLL